MSKKSEEGDENLDSSNSQITTSRSNDQKETGSKSNHDILTSHGLSSEVERNELNRYTPNTQFDDFQEEIFDDDNSLSDLKVKCPTCNCYLNLDEIMDHNEYHQALNFFDVKELPKSEELLIEKRKILIKSLASKYLKQPIDIDRDEKINEWNLKVKQINDKYELVKSFINNTFETARQIKNNSIKFDVQGESLISKNEIISAIGICAFQNKKHRINMEDSNVILDNFGGNENLTYIGTFDGYDGFLASNKCSIHLHLGILHYLSKSSLNKNDYVKAGYFDEDEINNLAKYYTIKQDIDYFNEMKSKDLISNKIKNENDFGLNDLEKKDNLNEDEYKMIKEYRNCFKYAYRQMDKLLSRGRNETSKKRWSGSTALTCIIENVPETKTGWIHIANCGDVEGIIITFDKNYKKYQKNTPKSRKYKILTRLHTLDDCVKDRESLTKNGCNIIKTSSGNSTIQGIYSFTRALGFNGDRSIKPFIISNPAVKSVKIESNYACLIIGTKGFWNVLTYDKVANITDDIFSSYSRINNQGRESQKFQSLNLVEPSSSANLKIQESININNSDKIIEEIDESDSVTTFSNNTISHSVISSSRTNSSLSTDTKYKNNSNIKSCDENNNAIQENLEEESENYYTKSSRAKTAPVSKNEMETKKFMKSQEDSSRIDNDLSIQMNDNPESILDSKVIKPPIIVEPKDSSKFKSNSDIYPSSKKNVLINESHDNNIDLKELELMEKSAIKYVYMPNSTRSNLTTNNDFNNDSNDLFNLNDANKSKIVKNSNKKSEYLIDLASYDVKAAQANEYDLKKTNLCLMKDRKIAKKLEFSQMLAENLVKCALLAGSVDNVTVNCVLLNDSIF